MAKMKYWAMKSMDFPNRWAVYACRDSKWPTTCYPHANNLTKKRATELALAYTTSAKEVL